MRSASLGRRIAALAVDCVLSVLVAMLFAASPTPGLIAAAVFFVSYTLFTGFYGQTPGMRLLGIACVRDNAGASSPVGIARAALRTLLLQLLVPAAILDTRGRGWHDRATGSVVVSVQRR